MNPYCFITVPYCSQYYLKILLNLFFLVLLLSCTDSSGLTLQALLDSATQHRSKLTELTFTPFGRSSKNSEDSESTDLDYQLDSNDNPSSQSSTDDSYPNISDYDAMPLSKSVPLISNDNSSSQSSTNDSYPSNLDYDNMDTAESVQLVKNSTTQPSSIAEIEQMHEIARYHFIEKFKEKMLSKLRLFAPPNMDDIPRHRYPTHVVDALEKSSELGFQNDGPANEVQDNYHAKIKTTLRFAEPFPAGKIHPKNLMKISKNTLYFTLPRDIDENNVDRSTLFVYPKWPASSNFTQLQLVVRSNYRPEEVLEKRKLPYSSTTTALHWQHIDTTKLVREWVESDDELNFGIVIELRDENDNVLYQQEPSHENADSRDSTERVSFIKLQLNDKKPQRRRNRRSTDQMDRVCELSDQEERCCRYRFVLDFNELGPDFDFVISPRRFTANYCAGQCPNFYLPASANSHLTAGLTRGKQSRCCTATDLEALNMVYVNRDGSINSGDLPGMSIARCGCE